MKILRKAVSCMLVYFILSSKGPMIGYAEELKTVENAGKVSELEMVIDGDLKKDEEILNLNDFEDKKEERQKRLDGPTRPIIRPIRPMRPPVDEPIEVEKKLEEEVDKSSKLNLNDHFAYIKGYGDDTLRPSDDITREEVAMIFYRLLNDDFRKEIESKSDVFQDIEEDRWSKVAISTLYNGNLLTGYEDGSFKPEGFVTRGEVAVIASRFSDLCAKENIFHDVDDHWAKDHINSANNMGWIKGYEDKSFRPDDNMKRSEFVSLINSVLGRKPAMDNVLEDIRDFQDLEKSDWYYMDMVEASNHHEYTDEDTIKTWTKVLNNR